MRSASEQSSAAAEPVPGAQEPGGQQEPGAQQPGGQQEPARAGPAPRAADKEPHKCGLRERKKARTRAAIRQHALHLFHEQGYRATTVDQIAEAAEVSPSTFFRYFPTKEDVVLQDDFDLLTLEAFEAQPPGLSPISALRSAWRETFARLPAQALEQFRQAAALSLAEQEIRARALDELAHSIQLIAEATAKRVGRDPDDFAVRNLAGAVVGVVVAATMAAAVDPAADMLESIDAALANLEAGLPL